MVASTDLLQLCPYLPALALVMYTALQQQKQVSRSNHKYVANAVHEHGVDDTSTFLIGLAQNDTLP